MKLKRFLSIVAALSVTAGLYRIFYKPEFSYIPLLISISGGWIVFLILRLMISKGKENSNEELVPGLTRGDFDDYLQRCIKSVEGMNTKAAKDVLGDSFPQLEELMKTMILLLNNCTEDPGDVLRFPLLPDYYERTEKMISEYVRLCGYVHSVKTEERLEVVKRKIPDLNQEFKEKLVQMHQDNIMELEIKSSTLNTLLKME